MEEGKLGASSFTADEWRQIVDSAIDTGIITTDLDGRVTSWSEGARHILGWSPEDMLGQSLERLFPDDLGVEALRREMADAQARGRGGGEEGWRVRKNGEHIWAAGEMTPIRAPDGRIIGFTKVLRDRSRQRAAELAVQEERQALEVLNRASSALAVEGDLGKIVEIVADAGVKLTGADFGAFLYKAGSVGGDGRMLRVVCGAPLEGLADVPRAWDRLDFADLFAGRGIVRSDDIDGDARLRRTWPIEGIAKSGLQMRSYLASPVISPNGEVIGGLFLGHPEPGRFTDQSERAVAGLSAEAAVAIENTRLVAALEHELAQRRAAEADLATSEDRLRLATEAADIGTWDFDPVSGELRWDERCKALFGLSPGAEVSYEHSFLAGLHPGDRDAIQAEVETALSPEGSGHYDVEYRTVGIEDGIERWVAATGRSVFENGKAVRFVGTVIDITEHKTTLKALRELNETLEARVAEEVAQRAEAEEALRQAQKMEAVGQLTGGIAHDFNNLLTVVTGNIGMAQRSLEVADISDARVRRSLDSAMKGAERAAALTQRLLAFSRRQPLAPKPIDMDKLVLGMSDLLQRSLGELVRLEIVTAPGLWKVEADPNQLENAILNLGLNARDAMPGGGELTIETANTYLDEGYAAQQAEVPPGHYVMIAVTDTGTGMSKEVADRVFEPFFTTKEVGKGSGLGLSMIYGFVKQSGGHVKVYSELGQGTTIKLYLPRLMRDAPEPEDAPRLSGGVEASPRQETILVVEDDDDVRTYTVECLRELGYRVLEGHDGASALRLLERQEEPVDLLFTDVVMPHMSGRELVEEARRRQPDLRVLYTSGYTRNAVVHAGRLDAGVEMIMKPFSFEALAQKVRDMLDAGRTGSMLVVEAEPTVRSLTAEALASWGYRAEEAGGAVEALGKLRSAQGRYDAVIVDDELPDGSSEELVQEMRARHLDLPIIMTSRGRKAELAQAFSSDRCTVVLDRPYTSARLQEALRLLGRACGSQRAGFKPQP